MEKDVIISIKGMQAYEGNEEDAVELVTEGRLLDCGEDGLTLTYQESELTGMEGTLPSFHLEKNGRVTLLRMGEVNSQMVFEEGRRHLSLYQTPYGELSVGVLANRVKNTVDMSGGELELDYAIELDHALAGQNLFRIQVREDKRFLKDIKQ